MTQPSRVQSSSQRSATKAAAGFSMRFLIDRDVERALAHDKAHRYEMRRCPRIGGREMTDPATGQKAGLMLGQHP
jgi:hypothetical protein